MEITKEELKTLLQDCSNEHYHFGQNTTFIREQHITVQSGANFYNGSQPEEPVPAEGSDEKDDIISNLTPIFFGDAEEARHYLNAIKGCKPTQVVSMTAKLVKKKKISDMSCNSDLWSILNRNGLYEPSLSNWNAQLRRI